MSDEMKLYNYIDDETHDGHIIVRKGGRKIAHIRVIDEDWHSKFMELTRELMNKEAEK